MTKLNKFQKTSPAFTLSMFSAILLLSGLAITLDASRVDENGRDSGIEGLAHYNALSQ